MEFWGTQSVGICHFLFPSFQSWRKIPGYFWGGGLNPGHRPVLNDRVTSPVPNPHPQHAHILFLRQSIDNCPGWPWICGLPASASWVAGITDTHDYAQLKIPPVIIGKFKCHRFYQLRLMNQISYEEWFYFYWLWYNRKNIFGLCPQLLSQRSSNLPISWVIGVFCERHIKK
jgi:hypothetical protein